MLRYIDLLVLVGAGVRVACMASSSSDGDYVDSYRNISATWALSCVASSCEQNCWAAFCQSVWRPELLSEVVCTGCIRWNDSRESMQYALDCLISLHCKGTRLMEHAPVYRAMGRYDVNTLLT